MGLMLGLTLNMTGLNRPVMFTRLLTIYIYKNIVIYTGM